MIGGFRQVISQEGASALLTGFGPTAAGYFLQGAFKFGGYELFKQQSINLLVCHFKYRHGNTRLLICKTGLRDCLPEPYRRLPRLVCSCRVLCRYRPLPSRGYPYPSRLTA